jgi:hypothetical protein
MFELEIRSMAKTRTWTQQDNELILHTIQTKGANRHSFTYLRETLKVTRHQLRNHLNRLKLTITGRKQAGEQVTQLNPTDQRVIDLEIKIREQSETLRDIVAQNLALKTNASVIAAVKDELDKRVQPIKPLPTINHKTKTKDTVDEALVMHLSDEHGDQEVLSHRVLGLEDYNFKVCLARAERYVKTTLEFTQQTLSNYRFRELWLLCYGDHISGEIHEATNHSYFHNAIKNAYAVGEMHGMMIRDLAPYFDQVNVLGLSGNHGRRKPKKEYTGALNNWDYAVHRTARNMLADHANVKFIVPDAFSAIVNIRGYNFHVNHGDDIKSWNSIPHYGIERKTRRLSTLHALNDTKINYFVMGHFHQLTVGQHPGGETIINGSFKATDEYALNSLAAANPPMQLIHGVHERYGMTWRLPVYLKYAGDTKGPERYRCLLDEP